MIIAAVRSISINSILPDGQCNLSANYGPLSRNVFCLLSQNNGSARRGDTILPDGRINMSANPGPNILPNRCSDISADAAGLCLLSQNNGSARRGDTILPDGQCNLSANYGLLTRNVFCLLSQNNGPARRGDTQ